eukprot:CAMPEP_0114650200 /NCGR_PEP_ID=MMETSP0191-20121206/7516_1 /TAXON_ID=126664 /ORGANISM="Sorites sp." /LENGTH=330 /DNA_ID=CAMNT_0001863997 /DNA_START=39 /DNA_END=1031 /DNA_ORIENTATION=+
MAPVLFLAYGQRRLEVLGGAGFDSVCHQAEAALSLHPQSYEIYDACGKVDADSFDRSLASSRGLCVLELREKPEWQKMRQMELQIQGLLDAKENQQKLLAADVEQQVAVQVEKAMQKLKAELSKDLVDKTDPKDSLLDRVDSLEMELSEQQIDVSADLGRLETACMTAQQEMEDLRFFAAEQLELVEKKQEKMKKELEEMEGIKSKVAQSVDELSEKVAAMDLDLTEQGITHSAVNGHLESGLATAKQELDLLRQNLVEQFTFLNSKMEQLEPKKLTIPSTIAWSDGFKIHDLEPTPSSGTYGKMGQVLWHSTPTLKRATKSLPQLPPLM